MKYAFGRVHYDGEHASVEGVDWKISNPDLLKEFPPSQIVNVRIGLFAYEVDDQFVFYIPLAALISPAKAVELLGACKLALKFGEQMLDEKKDPFPFSELRAAIAKEKP